ncbi:MAG: hypothetical protein ACI81G_001235, partial [Gammaproteobacteria bacterium]
NHMGKDEVRELKYKGKNIKSGDRLEKTSTVDLVLGDGQGNYRDTYNESTDTKTDGGK